MSYTVCIVGLGLMGGSMAMALKGFRRGRILGIDRDAVAREAALTTGTVDAAFAPDKCRDVLGQSDLTVLCLYPEAALSFFEDYAAYLAPHSVLTDVVGVKAPIVQAAQKHLPKDVSFVGGHPMAGREKSGFSAATGELFRGCNYVLTPTDDTNKEALELVTEMATYIGAGRVTIAHPEHHDHMIAYTSQMAHVLAAAIVHHPSLPHSPGFDGGSFADLTRVATLNEEMWSQLFLMNRQPLCETLRELENELCTLRTLIEKEDKAALRDALAHSTARKHTWEQEAARKRAAKIKE